MQGMVMDKIKPVKLSPQMTNQFRLDLNFNKEPL